MFGFTVRYAVSHRWAVLAAAVALSLVAFTAFRALPIEAFPDVTDPSVDVVATFPGQASEEVERRVTVELERVLAGTPRLTNLRAVSVFGLALVTLRFEDGSTDRETRAQVAERLREASLPEGVEAVLGPQATPVGQIYRYTVRGLRPLRELRALQDWVIERRLRAVPGVADVVTFGGFERQYEVRIDPVRLANLGVTVADVFRALERTNSNAGGGYVGIGSQEFVVRGLGTMRDPGDIGSALVVERGGLPVRVRDVADLVEGATPRRGSVGRGADPEVVEGIVLLRRGENPSVVLEALRARVAELNGAILPRDVRLDVFYDRGALIDATLKTVSHNLLHGAVLVVAVLYLFLRTLRGALIVAVVIPLALLTSFLGLSLMGRSANLISMGAVDFGILVDGAVVVLEATLHALSRRAVTPDQRAPTIAAAGAAVARPVGFAMLIIIAGLLPIFGLQRVEGRIFAPMAYTYVFALAGALVAAFTVVPALEAVALPSVVPHHDPPWLVALRRLHLGVLDRLRPRRGILIASALAAGVALAAFASGIGTEFLPELNEGGLYITAIFPSSISLQETTEHVPSLRARIWALPEARDVLSHVGRPEGAPQVEGPNNVEFFVALAPMNEWRHGLTRRDLEEELRRSLREVPGVQYNFSQPITDRVYETISGIIGQVVVKLRGDDLAALTAAAEELRDRIATVPGVTDLSLYQAGDSPELTIELDRERLARHGLTVDDAQQTIEIALGGKVATALWAGERRYGVALRLPDAVRADREALGRLVVGTPERRVTLSEVASVRFTRGRAAIWREDLSRFVAVKFNVRGRDLGSTVSAARARAAGVRLPPGSTVVWGGEFENQGRAMRRLAVTVPLALAVILGILVLNFRRWRPSLAIAGLLPGAAVGAVAALRVMGENFSVSGAVGCIALLGQVALGGVLVCSRIDDAAASGASDPTRAGAGEALRPVLLTSLLALLGLVPAALSHAMGSETQRPFAIAIIGGLVVALPAVLVVLPLLYGGARTPEGPARKEVPARGVVLPVSLAAALLALVAPGVARAQPALREAELVTRWLRHGRDVAALRTRIGAARFDIVSAGQLPNPEVAVGANSLVTGVPPDGRFNWSVQLSTPVPLGGQLGSRREAAVAALRVVELEVAAALWARSATLHAAAVERAFAAERVETLENNVSDLAVIEAIVRSRSDAGVNASYDAERLATAVATVRADIASAILARDRAEAELINAVSDPALEAAPITREGLLSFDLEGDEAALTARALARRPDLEAARRGVAAFQSQAARFRREAIPTPSVWLGALVTHGESSVSVLGGVSVPLPVFDRLQGAIGRAQAEADGQALAAQALEARIRVEVRSAMRARDSARTALSRFRESGVAPTSDLRERAHRAYQAGTFSVAELLDAHRAVWEARAQALALSQALVEASAALARATAALPVEVR